MAAQARASTHSRTARKMLRLWPAAARSLPRQPKAEPALLRRILVLFNVVFRAADFVLQLGVQFVGPLVLGELA